MRVAILSDTHGLLRPRVLELVAGSDRILHAGDVGDPAILDQLRQVAPVAAVRGNMDGGGLSNLPATVAGELDGLPYRMTHRREDIDPAWPREAGLIVFGHSHRPELEWRGGCLLLNPGAVGARRFKLPLTLALVRVTDGRLVPEIVAVE
ncbi:MAG: metallophosphoesterase family protein [bacterium]|nr:metallophosphoesterase family protein [bacterium]